MKEDALHRRLRAIEALHEGATTEGERVAAAQAKRRVALRLAKKKAPPRMMARVAFQQAAELERSPSSSPPAAERQTLPSTATLLARLNGWRHDTVSTEEIAAWAEELCDKLLLPEVTTNDPRAARVEVLLQLASMSRQPLHQSDIPHLEAFLRAKPGEAAWSDWFGWLASVDWHARRTHRHHAQSLEP